MYFFAVRIEITALWSAVATHMAVNLVPPQKNPKKIMYNILLRVWPQQQRC